MYRLREAVYATAGKQHNKTTNGPPQGNNLLIQEDGNDVTCAKGPDEDNSGDNFTPLSLIDNDKTVPNSPAITLKGGKDMLNKDLGCKNLPYSPVLANSDQPTKDALSTQTTMDRNDKSNSALNQTPGTCNKHQRPTRSTSHKIPILTTDTGSITICTIRLQTRITLQLGEWTRLRSICFRTLLFFVTLTMPVTLQNFWLVMTTNTMVTVE